MFKMIDLKKCRLNDIPFRAVYFRGDDVARNGKLDW
jgi:hypothetical protein